MLALSTTQTVTTDCNHQPVYLPHYYIPSYSFIVPFLSLLLYCADHFCLPSHSACLPASPSVARSPLALSSLPRSGMSHSSPADLHTHCSLQSDTSGTPC